MASSLLSPYWYRVEALHPKLGTNVDVSRQVLRGEAWYVLSHRHSGRQFRLNKLGYALVGRLDGRRSVQQIWDVLMRQLGDEAPTQHEVLRILNELSTAGMLHSENQTDAGAVFAANQKRNKHLDRRLNILALRIPLLDPSRLLERLHPFVKGLFTAPVFLIWCLLLLGSALLAALHAPELLAYGQQHLAQTRSLLVLALVYPLIKLCHELGHALAVRHWGGEVKEMGLTLFLIVPVPYVDASAAAAFAEKRRRILVSAMGVMVETSLACAALGAWLLLSDGVLRELAFAVIFIGAVTTVLVNGNPLMRFDGYYVFADWLEMPALASRANAYLRYLGERYLLGHRRLPVPAGCESRRPLLAGYGLAALIYRIGLFASLLGWLLGKQFAAGLLLLALLLFKFLLQPLGKLLRLVFHDKRLADYRQRAMAGFVLLATVLIGLFFLLPMPYVTRLDALVWLPEEARVRNEVEGVVTAVLVQDGQTVRAGQALIEMENPPLLAERMQVASQLTSRQMRYQSELLNHPAEAMALRGEIEALQARLNVLSTRIEALRLHAPVAGRVGIAHAQDLPGQYFQRGSVLANLISAQHITLRAAVSQDDIDLLRLPGQRVELRLASARDVSLPARQLSETPAGSFNLPGAALGRSAGGRFATDPGDKDGLRTDEPIFFVDFQVDAQALNRIGERARIRIEHPPATLAKQLARQLRQLFVRQFNVADTTGSWP